MIIVTKFIGEGVSSQKLQMVAPNSRTSRMKPEKWIVEQAILSVFLTNGK